MEFYERLADILNNISGLIAALSKSSVEEQGLFNKTAKAALVNPMCKFFKRPADPVGAEEPHLAN